MARKQQKETEVATIIVKVLFTIGGTITGVILTFYVCRGDPNVAELSVGALIGAILGWLWANKEFWRD
ncbi:MAG: hypothetical protein RMK89_05405 [Armatimonadota bacterium]|nr:hypothetical protein [Armatimonadota bacterium]MDW8142883.1 hypothetical protein [Armatimonadota bacterium]